MSIYFVNFHDCTFQGNIATLRISKRNWILSVSHVILATRDCISCVFSIGSKNKSHNGWASIWDPYLSQSQNFIDLSSIFAIAVIETTQETHFDTETFH